MNNEETCFACVLEMHLSSAQFRRLVGLDAGNSQRSYTKTTQLGNPIKTYENIGSGPLCLSVSKEYVNSTARTHRQE